jgi:hypothetical protein
MDSPDQDRALAQSAEDAAYAEASRERVLAAALERRLREVDRLQRESDALRAEVAVRDGYVADLRRRLVDLEEQLAVTQRELARRRFEEAERVHEEYVRYALDEAAIRQRLEEAIMRVGRLRDRERVEALRVQRSMLSRR